MTQPELALNPESIDSLPLIRINLAPPELLENKYWYLPDVALFLFVLILSFGGVLAYQSHLENETAKAMAQSEEFEANTRRLAKAVQKAESLQKEITALEHKIAAIADIVISPLLRTRHVILLEKLQQLRPPGLWFKHLSLDTETRRINLVGQALDGLIVSDFIAALLDTARVIPQSNDLRTQLRFTAANLVKLATNDGNATVKPGKRKAVPGADAVAALSDTSLMESKGSAFWSIGDSRYPEFASYPHFEINIAYSEGMNVEPIAGLQPLSMQQEPSPITHPQQSPPAKVPQGQAAVPQPQAVPLSSQPQGGRKP